MPEIKKLAEEDIQSIVKFRQEYMDIVNQLGQLEATKISIEKSKEALISQLENLAKREEELTSEIEAKYGIGSINLETGEFIPQSE